VNYEQADAALKSGAIVRRKAWPKQTALVMQGGYNADLSKWSDRSPLSRVALAHFGFTESFKINAHVDMISAAGLTCGYVFTREDIVAEDWEKVEIPQPAAGVAEGPSGITGANTTEAPTGVTDNLQKEPGQAQTIVNKTEGGDINGGEQQNTGVSQGNGNLEQSQQQVVGDLNREVKESVEAKSQEDTVSLEQKEYPQTEKVGEFQSTTELQTGNENTTSGPGE
jgi:hypothetical protein